MWEQRQSIKVCGSGMKAIMLGANALALNEIDIAIGGMENMTLAPHLTHVRGASRMGHLALQDHLFLDGLEDAYEGGLMGNFAQKTADEYGIAREEMDAFACESLTRANQAREAGYFKSEIAPVMLKKIAKKLLMMNCHSNQM